MKKKNALYEHLTPFIAAVFPVLSLAFENIEFIQFSSILRSLLFSVLAAYIFYGLFYLVLRNWQKAGILSAILIFIFLSYGNVYLLLAEQFGEVVRHRYLILIFAAIFILIALYVIFKVKDAKNLNTAIFTMGLVIFAYLLISVGVYKYREYRSQRVVESKAVEAEVPQEVTGNLPDIYLIVLDGHTRSDVLEKAFNLDNKRFINELENLGFFVADCANSNYPLTDLSMGSMFEMDYFHNLYEGEENIVLPPLSSTSVLRILKQNNFEISAFDNFYYDHFKLSTDSFYSKEDGLFGSINEFESMLVQTSMIRVLVDMEGFFPKSWVRPFKDDIYLSQYRDVVYALENITELPERDAPQFVYMHTMVTHDPFVFLPDGSMGSSKMGEAQSYRDAVEYIDLVVPGILEELINESEIPPIIILMGDHGSTINGVPIDERLSILYAIYLQGEELQGLSESTTPVNVFRLIFNHIFNSDYDLLEDNSYRIWDEADLLDTSKLVPNTCK